MIAAGLFAKTLRRRKTANLPAGLALRKLREGDAGRSVFIRVNL